MQANLEFYCFIFKNIDVCADLKLFILLVDNSNFFLDISLELAKLSGEHFQDCNFTIERTELSSDNNLNV